jgi:hypothetical protein
MRSWIAGVSKCRRGFGLSGASLVADFGTATALERQATTSLPIPFATNDLAILSGTQRVSSFIKELFGTGTRIGFDVRKLA